MGARSDWRLLLPLMLTLTPHDVRSQTPEGAGPPVLFVTRLQGPSTQNSPSGQPAPSRSDELPPLPATTLDDRQPAANLDGPRRISLTVPHPMPLGALLLLLVNGTPFSLVDGDAVSGATFTGDLRDLTMRQAIEAVLFSRALDYDVQGTLIRVFPRRMSTRLFNVNYLNTRRSLAREVRSSSSVASLSSSVQSDLFDELEKGVQSLLSASGRMHLDRTAGLVQVTDFADRLDQVGVYVEAVQLRATRQVRIDADVFEVAFPAGGPRSIDWRAPAIRRATSPRPATDTGSSSVASTDIAALKTAIAEQGSVTTIASPQVVAMNNEPAIVRFGSSAASRDSSPTGQLDDLTLMVVAQISADRVVQMHVSPSYATRSGPSPSSDVLSISEADTVVRVLDGETVVLSGLLSGRETSRTGSSTALNQGSPAIRSELVILLTPTIVRSAGSPH
jgi:MSHA biogenesis protein MshL